MACKDAAPRWNLSVRDVSLAKGLCGAGSLIFQQGGKTLTLWLWCSPSYLPLTGQAKLKHPNWCTSISDSLGPGIANRVWNRRISVSRLPKSAIFSLCCERKRVGKHRSRHRRPIRNWERWLGRVTHLSHLEEAPADRLALSHSHLELNLYICLTFLSTSIQTPNLSGLTSGYLPYSVFPFAFLWLQCSWSSLKMQLEGDFPGGKESTFQCRGHRFDPWSGN